MNYITYTSNCLFSSCDMFHSVLVNEYDKKYTTEYGCLYAASDVHAIEDIIQKAEEKLHVLPTHIIVIGIGGSYAGTKAIYDALSHEIKRPLIFVDTFDEYELHCLIKQIQQAASRNENILCVVVSKSGTTLETIVNFEVMREVFQVSYPDNWKELLVIISDETSPLTEWADKHNCMALSIPSLIGGRFSVFTAVGLFPLALCGIDVRLLCDGASSYMKYALNDPNNMSWKSAAFLHEHYNNGCIVYDMFLFHKRLESLGKWYRQLCAESLGKKRADENKMKLLPTVSIGTTDLHSVTQLMLGAQPSVVTTFVTVQSSPQGYEVKHHGIHLSDSMNKAAYATQKAYELVGLPYDIIILPELTPYYIGQFMQIYMVQVLYMAQMCEVNPFDQPHVELYKNIMRQL